LVALGALVKPHALILLPAIVLYLLLENLGRPKDGRLPLIKWLLGFVGVLVATRVVVGFLLAGMKGLNPLGPDYTRVLERFFQAGLELWPTSFLASGSASSAAAEAPGILEFAPSLLGNFTLIGLGLLLPVLMATRWKTATSKTRSLALLVTTLTAIYVGAIYVWAIVATSVGDSQLERMLGRYFEFLIPLAIVAYLASIREFAGSDRRMQVRAGVGLILGSFSLASLGLLIQPQLFDSTFIYAVLYSPFATTAYLIITTLSGLALAAAGFKRVEQWLAGFGIAIILF
jgi:phosphoglycerol transferase